MLGVAALKFVDQRAARSQALVELAQTDAAARAGELNVAVLHATRAAVLAPSDHLALLSLAELYERLGDKPLAVAHYRQVLGILEADPAAAGERSHIAQRLKSIAGDDAPDSLKTKRE